MSKNEICVPAIKLTKERLLEERSIINDKIKALDIVLEMFDKSLPKVKNPDAVALGRLGGLKGGKARTEKLSPEERSEIAKKAAKARWRKKIDYKDMG